MRGGVHDIFTVITAHTAKCDLCNQHNKDKMYRCQKCGRQQCTPCWEKKGGDGRHSLHNKDILKYKGPKAENLPPKEDPKRTKTADTSPAPTAQGSGQKRSRATTTSAMPASNVGAYAPTSSSSPSDVLSYESDSKRIRRKAPANEAYVPNDTDEEDTYWTPKYGPLQMDKPETSTKEHRRPQEESPKRKNSDVSHYILTSDNLHLLNLHQREYPLESAVNKLIDAAGSDTESDEPDMVESSKDHVGVNSILQAADILERNFTHMHSSPPAMPAPTAAEPNGGVRTPPHTQAWTPVNPSKTFPNHRVKTYQQDEAPVGYGRVGYNPDTHPTTPAASTPKAGKASLLNDPRHKYKDEST
ncbi:MAG: hypothetical protein Q9184_000851 [Pyrenodesmia sp. 2 TL-2023]